MSVRLPLAAAAKMAGVGEATIRSWARQGRVMKYPDGYDTYELLLWMEQRNLAALCARAGAKNPADVATYVQQHADPRTALKMPA